MTARAWLLLASLSAMAYGASLDVPYVHQRKQGCGAASIAMVMQYWANRGAHLSPGAADPSAIYRALYRPELRGSNGGDMVAYLRDRTFTAFAIDASWGDLVDNVSRGRPLIVCLGPSRDAPLHYVVVIGIEGSDIVLHDPARSAHVLMRASSFQSEWRRTDNWTLIATPERIP